MPRSISWIDPTELTRLAIRAAREDAPPPMPSTPRVVAVPPPAPPKAPPEPPPFSPGGDSLEKRVTQLMDWLQEYVGVERLFVADSNGLAVDTRGVSPEHVATSAVLMHTLHEVRRHISSERRMAITMGPDAVLHIVAMDTDWGAFGVGLVADDLLPDAVLARAQEALAQTLEEGATDE